MRLTLFLVTCYSLSLYLTLVFSWDSRHIVFMCLSGFFFCLSPPHYNICSTRIVLCFVPYCISNILRSSYYLCSGTKWTFVESVNEWWCFFVLKCFIIVEFMSNTYLWLSIEFLESSSDWGRDRPCDQRPVSVADLLGIKCFLLPGRHKLLRPALFFLP